MTTPNESSTLSDLLVIESEEVDYGSDVEYKTNTPMCYDRPRQAPNPFTERGVLLDEEELPSEEDNALYAGCIKYGA